VTQVISDAHLRPQGIPSNPVVVVLDYSSSMSLSSKGEIGRSMNPTRERIPTRMEVVCHMAKILYLYCKELGRPIHFYLFNGNLHQLCINTKTSNEQVFAQLEAAMMNPNGGTHIARALSTLYEQWEDEADYFLLTDGEAMDGAQIPAVMYQFQDASFHCMCFSADTKRDLLKDVVSFGEERHTISYIQDMESLMGYMIPIFVHATALRMQASSTSTLTAEEEEVRQEYVNMLAPQLNGKRGAVTKEDMLLFVRKQQEEHPTSKYIPALVQDTCDTTGKHGRLFYSFSPDHWKNFGMFYVLTAWHNHKYKIPGNGFDLSLQFYQTPAHIELRNFLRGKAETIPFSLLIPIQEAVPVQVKKQCQERVQKSIERAEEYSSSFWGKSNDNEGCIHPDAAISMADGTTKWMKDLQPGDAVSTGCVRWIMKIQLPSNYQTTFYGGLTEHHPVKVDEQWVQARELAVKPMEVKVTEMYNIVLVEEEMMYVEVNGHRAAVGGVSIPGLEHPFWGTKAVRDLCEYRTPGGGWIQGAPEEFVCRDVCWNAYSLL
jgi:hypothetical protein